MSTTSISPAVVRYREARRRLALPPYARASREEFTEGTECTGCTAHYESGLRIVNPRHDCPTHYLAPRS